MFLLGSTVGSRALALVLVSLGSIAACSATTSDDENVASGDDALTSKKVDDEWFYSGPLPALESPAITASLAGHTAHLSGLLPAGVTLPSDLPHVKTTVDANGRTHVDVVYPIATANGDHSNSRPGTYSFYEAKPYRPNGPAYTQSLGWHQVTWGGFPFIAYNNGIAFHGPITDEDNESPDDLNVWYLRRGNVSSGCNRMMGEHVVELTHAIGINMRKVYEPNHSYTPTTTAKVTVIADYDMYGGKYIDVDYPTDTGAVRPSKVHGVDNVVMFGSWVASEMPNGKDLPPDMKWEGGVSGQLYDFQAHARTGVVCSMPKTSLGDLKTVAAHTNGVLPQDFCAKKAACDAQAGHVCKATEISL